MKRSITYYLILISLLIYNISIGQSVKIGLITTKEIASKDNELKAAKEFLRNNSHTPEYIYLEDLTSTDDLKDFDNLWFHHNDSSFIFQNDYAVSILNQYLENGGNLLLTLEAFRFINDMKIEPTIPETRIKKSNDEGYGRKLGLHSFRNHPVFKGLNGGAYIFKPARDTSVRITGYFGENIPQNGAVVAVDWDYIFLRENTKLITEYWVGKGRVLAVGAYTCLSQVNENRQHIELFLNNCFTYLNQKQNDQANYWQYYPQEVHRIETDYQEMVEREDNNWEIKKSNITLHKKQATNDFWDASGQRMLMMGKQKGGIEEIWSHPFMAFRNYQVGIKFLDIDSIIWLNHLKPKIEVDPTCFKRTYQLENSTLNEFIVCSVEDPIGVIHYEFSGDEPVDLFIKIKSNMRLMWPYSENVFKTLDCSFDVNLNAFLVSEESGSYAALIGSNKEAVYTNIGQIEDFEIEWSDHGNREVYYEFIEIASDKFEVSGISHYQLFPEESFDVVIAADYTPDNSKAIRHAVDHYFSGISNAQEIYNNTFNYSDLLLKNSLIIESPDTVFNKGYQWALAATDRFFVSTPGLGKSLVAGYSTTKTGWDGGHDINGRPGYSWYYGRDGQWSAFALLDYGDFEKAKSILKMYQDLQDLNGKIFHEVSTSGVVHFDAADATPLYLILAGKYLRHSGDIEFIKESWPHINKAIQFCFSTDTDEDHLIENTNVGHGWVEGGHLFGSHSSLYLSSCWAAALKEVAYLTEALEMKDGAGIYLKESKTVTSIINNDFWDKENQFLYHGKYTDGTFCKEQSIMPAIPIYFNQLSEDKASEILPVFAENNYSSDWGCRIVSKSSSKFNPKGYHSGSVWPLYTGWISLAEYTNNHDVPAFTHLMNNLQVYQHWGLGFIEEVLNGETYMPSGVCPHQCWSETMVLQPAIEGMLGLKVDALDHSVNISPAFPANWDSAQVRNIRIGNHLVHFEMKRNKNVVTYNFKHTGSSNLLLNFDPKIFDPSLIHQIIAKGDYEQKRLNKDVPVSIYIDKTLTLEYEFNKLVKVFPIVTNPQPGDTSNSIKVLDEKFINGNYVILIEGPEGSKYTIEVLLVNAAIKDIKNGSLIGHVGDIIKIETTFDRSDNSYSKKEIKITLR